MDVYPYVIGAGGGGGVVQPPQIVTTAGTNVYVTGNAFVPFMPVPAAHKEPTPLEWLRDQVTEMCDLAGAA